MNKVVMVATGGYVGCAVVQEPLATGSSVRGGVVNDCAVGGSAHVLQVRNVPLAVATLSLAIDRWLADASRGGFCLEPHRG